MLVLAREVILVPVTGPQIKMRRDLALAHDVTGKWYRPCSLFIVPFHVCTTCGYTVDERERRLAEHVYPGESHVMGFVDIPDGRWLPSVLLKQILYWRSPRAGRFQHPFNDSHKHLVQRPVPFTTPVMLSRSQANPSFFRVDLPNGCVINPPTHVGLVRP